MSDELKKKKIMIKKKVPGAAGVAKPVIKLNKPAGTAVPASAPETEKLSVAPAEVVAPKPKIVLNKPAAPAPAPEVAAEPATPAPSPAGKAEVEAVNENSKFFCVYCGQKLAAPRAAAGKTITCPACQAQITIPPPRD